jgi:hypothetical protein
VSQWRGLPIRTTYFHPPTRKVDSMKLYRLSQGEFRSWRDRQARAALKERVFAQHGDAQLRAPSGRILGTVRAPEKSARVPIEKSTRRGAHHAVAPGECICREWQKPAGKEDEHHPICALKGPWEAQQARSPDVPRERVVVSELREARDTVPAPPEVAAAVTDDAATSATQPQPAPPPGDCVCREWAGAIADSHHPLCTFRKAWEAQQGRVSPQLVELETGTVIREATDEEVAASKAKATEDGVGAIELSDGKLYYVKGS